MTKEEVHSYLNFVYYGNLPEIPRSSEQFKRFIWCLKTLRPDYYFKLKESCGHDQEPHEEGEDQSHPAEHLPSSLPLETLPAPKNTEKKIEAGKAALIEDPSRREHCLSGVLLQRQGCNGAMWEVWTGLSHLLYRPT